MKPKPLAIYRVYEVTTAIIAGQKIETVGRQINGNFNSHTEAEAAAKISGVRCQINLVGGCE